MRLTRHLSIWLVTICVAAAITVLTGPATGLGTKADTATDTDAAAVLRAAEAALRPVPAAARARQDPGSARDLTLLLNDLTIAYPRLSADEKRRADVVLARPDRIESPENDLKNWTVDEETPECGPHVCVHYVASTEDEATTDWVGVTLDEMEGVWAHAVDDLGYRAPAPDGTKGGDAKFDVYLADIAPYYGYCLNEGVVAGQSRRAPSYCVLDNDFAGFASTPLVSLRATAPHEFFHAIQFNYDFTEDRWLMEATATWMEERYADSVNDNRQYLPYGQLNRPDIPLDTFSGNVHYGNWIFFEKLSRKYGVDSVRRIWRRLDASTGKPDLYSTQAIRRYLDAQDTTLRRFYAVFAAGNLKPSASYHEGAAYDAAPIEATFTLGPRRRAVPVQRETLSHLTSKSFRFKIRKSLRG
ncbi:MAG: MXAN_6640 family putative metalloprotease, partial [Nocardioides sp.]